MSSWRQAHRIAHISAVHAQTDLGISREHYVDVFAAIRRAGVPMKFEPLKRLFGIYICPASGGPGILLNSALSVTALRHTAAHELGHHHLRHGDMIDQQFDPWTGSVAGVWSAPEMCAEAFAAWFLMPKPSVLRGLAMLGLQHPASALHAYRLATLLGASFRGMCRHLINLRLVSANVAESWVRVGRSRLRRQLAGDMAEVCVGEVHRLTPAMTNLTIHSGTDDLVVLELINGNENIEISPPHGLADVTPTQRPAPIEVNGTHSCDHFFRIAPDLTEPVTIRTASHESTQHRIIEIQPISVPHGIDLHWLEARDSVGQGEDPTWSQ